jgi:hypothetical protein
MEYSKMVRQAVSSGEGEEAMWKSVARVDSLLEDIKEENPDMYWKFLREAHEDLYGMHYTPEYAEYDLSRLHYTDSEGVKRTGAHWSLKDVLAVTANKTYPEGTTDCDKWVAYNAAYADFCRRFSDNEILDIAYLFYFDDEDAPEGKVWRYMSAMR